jgi:hypothetical protein
MDASATTAVVPSRKLLWTGRIISAIVVLFLILGSTFGIIMHEKMAPEFAKMGYPMSLQIKISVLCILCALIYAIPRTAVLGAILLTGYLGGATATHVRLSQPFFFPVLAGVLVWLGLFLRDARLRALLPWRS